MDFQFDALHGVREGALRLARAPLAIKLQRTARSGVEPSRRHGAERKIRVSVGAVFSEAPPSMRSHPSHCWPQRRCRVVD